VTNAFFASLHGLSVGPFPPLDHTRSASQSPRSSRAAMDWCISGFRQRLGGGVALRLRSAKRFSPFSTPLPARRPQTEASSKLRSNRITLFISILGV